MPSGSAKRPTRRSRRPAKRSPSRLTEIEGEIYQYRNRSSQDPLNYPIRLNNKLAALQGIVESGDYKPTDQSYAVFKDLSARLDKQLAQLDALAERGAAGASTSGWQARSCDRSRIAEPDRDREIQDSRSAISDSRRLAPPSPRRRRAALRARRTGRRGSRAGAEQIGRTVGPLVQRERDVGDLLIGREHDVGDARRACAARSGWRARRTFR